MLTRIFGYKIIEFFFSERTRSKMDLREYSEESIERVVFIAFLIPGTPKDFLAYAVGLTPLSLLTWIRITVIARFPPIIMATLGGNLLSSGNFQSAAVTILIGNVISLFVYLLYELHHRWKRRSA